MGINTIVIVVVPPKFVRPPEMPADGTMEDIAADYTEMGLVVESLVYPKAFD